MKTSTKIAGGVGVLLAAMATTGAVAYASTAGTSNTTSNSTVTTADGTRSQYAQQIKDEVQQIKAERSTLQG